MTEYIHECAGSGPMSDWMSPLREMEWYMIHAARAYARTAGDVNIRGLGRFWVPVLDGFLIPLGVSCPRRFVSAIADAEINIYSIFDVTNGKRRIQVGSV